MLRVRCRPFWVSPRQAIIVPVSQQNIPYAKTVYERVYAAGFEVALDASTRTLNKKIREGQLAQYNFILVVGAEEQSSDSVNIRARDNNRVGTKTMDETLAWFKTLAETYQ
jgi:threonyl-tRNA synthetase